MRFNPKARVDQSEFRNVGRGGGRGRGRAGSGLGGGLGGSGGGLPIPIPSGGSLGIGTILIIGLVLAFTYFGGSDLIPGVGDSPATPGQNATSTECATGADADDPNCAAALFTRSVQDFWETTYPEQTGRTYQPATTTTFAGQISTGCGAAGSEVGPFYCPPDHGVYLDTTFFDDMLRGQLGARGGPFAMGYVIAHEFGHHIENQLGILGRMRSQQGATSDAVKVELMADCLAGMWAAAAEQTRDRQGETIIEDITQDDIARAIDAAQAVGDDRIQKRTSGRVNPDQWTHGSAQQRVQWFNVGMKQGTIKACNTFAKGAL